jgi:hypothetical protein
MEAFYAIENRLSSIFLQRRKSFLLRYPLRLAHRQALSQTSRTTIDELPGRHHLHEPYILLSCWLLTVTLIGCSKARTPVEARQPEATPGSPTQPGKANIDPCSLLTAEEIESVQGEPVKDTHSSSNTGRGFVVSQCFFMLPTSANSISLNLTQSSGGTDGRDPKELWRKSFHRDDELNETEKKDNQREEEEEKKAPPERITDLGDEAFWTGTPVGSALYVLKGDLFLRISVGGSGDPASKLAKSKTLAQLILKGL